MTQEYSQTPIGNFTTKELLEIYDGLEDKTYIDSLAAWVVREMEAKKVRNFGPRSAIELIMHGYAKVAEKFNVLTVSELKIL